MKILRAVFRWIFTHKKIVFVYIPFVVMLCISAYVGVIYVNWTGDREHALKKLAKYKQLIDRTEELRKGYVYSYSDVDLSAKVVDIPTRIYDRDNEIIGEFFEQKREIVPYDYIPQWIIKGVIASEDRDFYNHGGINPLGILRALVINIINFSVVQGGSTITQQLAKVLFTDMERSIKRKVYEMFCAFAIEKRYDKQDILSMYLNLIYFGNGAYGVESTARMFFGRSVRELNEVECAMIVGTISSPRSYSPLSNLDNSIRKTKRILKSMADAGYINKKRSAYKFKRFLEKWDVKFDKENRAVSSLIGSFVYSSYRVNRAPFFNERIRRVLVEKFGEDSVKKGGLNVYTTIDAKKQDIALEALRKGIRKQRDYHLRRSQKIRSKKRSAQEKEKAENIEGALVSLNPYTGEIIAYVGGSEFTARNQNDSVSQILRQPGSSFKPVLYTAAIENRDITASTKFVDEKTVFKGGYTPENYGKKYYGEMIVRDALRKSINIVAVKILRKTGYDTIFNILQKSLLLDKRELTERFGRTLSLALGTYELSPLENCVLHSVILNGGDFIRPYGIRYVKDYNGHMVWNYEEEVLREIEEKRREFKKIIDPIAGAITVSLLRGVLEPGGTAAWTVKNRGISFQIAGKTGTSSNFADAWFAGYTSNLVSVVWIGNKTGSISLGRGRSGGSLAAPVWVDFISRVYKDIKPADFPVPDEGVSRETICNESGKVANRDGRCPDTCDYQLYYAGTEPGEYCDLHEKKAEESPKNE